jgi:hypothetical protein
VVSVDINAFFQLLMKEQTLWYQWLVYHISRQGDNEGDTLVGRRSMGPRLRKHCRGVTPWASLLRRKTAPAEERFLLSVHAALVKWRTWSCVPNRLCLPKMRLGCILISS